jgi:uncharacterized DUF497 family protein
MHIDYLVWDDWNVEHIAGHGITVAEVEWVCHAGQSLVRRAGVTRYGLMRHHVYGQTTGGRYLFIVLDHETPGVFYTVTARDMTEREKQLLRRVRDE